MHIRRLHEFDVTTKEAAAIQVALAPQVIMANVPEEPRLILGLDVAISRDSRALAAAVVLSYPSLELVEKALVEDRVNFPYVPGLLSFREIPITLKACERLVSQPDLVMVDGQGMAHPRRLGLASHLGLFLDVPTIGCAKSRLCGDYTEPGTEAGSRNDLIAGGDTIGIVLRTKTNSKVLFVSVGHKIDLLTAADWVLKCCRDHRLPEPTRLAHLASKGRL